MPGIKAFYRLAVNDRRYKLVPHVGRGLPEGLGFAADYAFIMLTQLIFHGYIRVSPSFQLIAPTILPAVAQQFERHFFY